MNGDASFNRARRRTYLEVARRESALDPLDRRARGPATVGCAEQRADVALARAPRRPCEVYMYFVEFSSAPGMVLFVPVPRGPGGGR